MNPTNNLPTGVAAAALTRRMSATNPRRTMSNVVAFPTPSLGSQIRESEIERITAGLLDGVSLVELTGFDIHEVMEPRKRDARGRYRAKRREDQEAVHAVIKFMSSTGAAKSVTDSLGLSFFQREPGDDGSAAA